MHSSDTNVSNIKIKMMFFYFLLIALFMIIYTDGVAKYISLLAFSAIVFTSSAFRISKEVLKESRKKLWLVGFPICIYSVISLIRALLNNSVDIYYPIQTIIFYILPLFFSLAVYLCTKNKRKVVIIIFWATALQVFNGRLEEITTLTLTSNLLESTAALPLSIFTLYFFHKKNKIYFLNSLIFLILANKRIANGAVLLAIIIYYICIHIKSYKKMIYFITISLFVSIYLFNYFIYTGVMQSIYHRFNINDMGRFNVYELFFIENIFDINYMGRGLGYVRQNLIESIQNSHFNNLHNDWLAMIIDMGILMTVFFMILSMIQIFKFSKKTTNSKQYTFIFCCYIIYYCVWLTGNINIYIHFLSVFYLLQLFELDERYVTDSIRVLNKQNPSINT